MEEEAAALRWSRDWGAAVLAGHSIEPRLADHCPWAADGLCAARQLRMMSHFQIVGENQKKMIS